MIQWHTREGGWFFISIFGKQPLSWLMHNGWACWSWAWFWRFTFGCRLESARHRNRNTFFDFHLGGPLYWRSKHRFPASRWFATFGRLVVRKWWVPGPEVSAA